VIHLSLVYIETPNRGHGVPSPYAAERSLVTWQPGGKEPARKAAVGWAPTAQETAAVHSAAAGDAVRRSTRGSGIRAGIRQGGMGTERTRREKPWCDAGGMLLRYGLKFAGPSRRAELLPRLGLPALGSHHKIFYFLSYSSKVSLGYFHLESFNRVSC